MGKIRSDAEEQRRLESGEGGRVLFGDWKRTETERKVCLGLEKVAEEVGAKNITAGMKILQSPAQLRMLIDWIFSCYRVGDAEVPLRVPHHRRAQDRTHESQHRGT